MCNTGANRASAADSQRSTRGLSRRYRLARPSNWLATRAARERRRTAVESPAAISPPVRHNTVRVVLGTGIGVALAIFTAYLLTTDPGRHHMTAPLGSLTFALLACGWGFGAAFAARGRQRSSWMILATGLSGWVLGDCLWVALTMTKASTGITGWLAGLGYLLLPVTALAATVLIPSNTGTRFGLRLMLDALLITASLLMITAIATHYLDRRLEISAVISVTCTTAYFALAAVCADVALKTGTGRGWSPGLTTSGFLVLGLTGVTTGQVIGPGDTVATAPVIGWACGLYCLALAGMTSRPGPGLDTATGATPKELNRWLTVAPLTLATALGAVYLWPDYTGRAAVFCVGLVVVAAALVRHVLLLEHNRRLQLNPATPALAGPAALDTRLTEILGTTETTASVIAFALTDFAMIKSAVGYATAELLLQQVATRIHVCVQPAGMVTRVGEDTFAVVTPGSGEAAGVLATQIVAAFDEPLRVASGPAHVYLRYGLASTSSQTGPGSTVDGLLDHALSRLQSAACGPSAQRACSSVPIIDCKTTSLAAAGGDDASGLARVQLIHDLRLAVANSELTLLYQPKIDLDTGWLSGAEALLRWPHQTLGLLAPADFLPLVNTLQLTDDVADIVLRNAVADAASWSISGPPVPIAVNISAPSLVDPSLPSRIQTVLESHHVAAPTLTVEITEDLFINDLDQARNVLHRLRKIGVRVAIDDFGSGYGSMTYLRALPIDDVKIDRQFIAPITHDVRAAAIVKATIELAKTLDITVTAEGVEDQQTADRLREYGCRYAQGNYFSPPIPAERIRPLAAPARLVHE